GQEAVAAARRQENKLDAGEEGVSDDVADVVADGQVAVDGLDVDRPSHHGDADGFGGGEGVGHRADGQVVRGDVADGAVDGVGRQGGHVVAGVEQVVNRAPQEVREQQEVHGVDARPRVLKHDAADVQNDGLVTAAGAGGDAGHAVHSAYPEEVAGVA